MFAFQYLVVALLRVSAREGSLYPVGLSGNRPAKAEQLPSFTGNHGAA
jgi:hypothetical protein